MIRFTVSEHGVSEEWTHQCMWTEDIRGQVSYGDVCNRRLRTVLYHDSVHIRWKCHVHCRHASSGGNMDVCAERKASSDLHK